MGIKTLTIAALIQLLSGMNQEDTVTLYNPENGAFEPLTAEDIQTIQAEMFVGDGSEDEEVIAKNVLVSSPEQSEKISVLCLNSNLLLEEQKLSEPEEVDFGIEGEVNDLMECMDGVSLVISRMPPIVRNHAVITTPGLAAYTKVKADILDNIAKAQRGMYGLLEVISHDKQHEDEYNAMVAAEAEKNNHETVDSGVNSVQA